MLFKAKIQIIREMYRFFKRSAQMRRVCTARNLTEKIKKDKLRRKAKFYEVYCSNYDNYLLYVIKLHHNNINYICEI